MFSELYLSWHKYCKHFYKTECLKINVEYSTSNYILLIHKQSKNGNCVTSQKKQRHQTYRLKSDGYFIMKPIRSKATPATPKIKNWVSHMHSLDGIAISSKAYLAR
jgi:hypothetical protein